MQTTADFIDTHHITHDVGEAEAFVVYLDMMQATPRWIERLMWWRNTLVSVFGIKNLGQLSAVQDVDINTVQCGERIGIFTLESKARDQVVLSDRDKHLDVTLILALNRQHRQIAITTAVTTHNLLGRLYLLPVMPLHQRIVPAVLRAYTKLG